MSSDLHNCTTLEADSVTLEKFKAEVIAGLSAEAKSLPSKYFYDEAGDRLFQEIMSMPEYYLTDCELDIFKNRTSELADIITKNPAPFDLIELGAGDAMKSSYLLEYLGDRNVEFTYRPIDISAHILQVLEEQLAGNIPGLKVESLAGEYFEMLAEATSLSSRRKVVLFLGGNIGNMERNEIGRFCKELSQYLAKGDIALIGFDLRKDPQTILDAYNDPAGVTRAFNLNILTRMNRELEADFNLANFKHYQTYDPLSGACRSFLVSKVRQQVSLAGKLFCFEENELIYVEISQKFSAKEIDELARKSGFRSLTNIQDSKGWFVDAVWELSNKIAE